jgi:hypothetical protein
MHILNSEKVLFTPLGDEGVLFHLETNEYFSTNETLSKIVLGLQNQSTKEQIIENILNEFEIDEVSCAKSVENALQTLQGKGLID